MSHQCVYECVPGRIRQPVILSCNATNPLLQISRSLWGRDYVHRRTIQPKPISESSVELFPRNAWTLFARTNTFVNRLLLCFRPGELIIQQLAKALLLVGRKLWQLFKDLLETHPYM